MGDDKEPLAVRIALFIIGRGIGFVGCGISVKPAYALGFAGLVVLAFWKGPKALAFGLILGPLAFLLAARACSMQMR